MIETKDDIIRKKNDAFKQKNNEEFTDRVVLIFDPLSLIAKETSRLTASTQARVFKEQCRHHDRLMHKSSNQNFHGLAEYLDSFCCKDEDKPKKIVKQILEDTYNYRKEELLLKSLLNQIKKFGGVGGPASQKFMDDFP